MTELPLIAGLIAGSMHVLSGPDHLAAIAPLAVREPARAWRTGATWGLGHGLGVALLGSAGALARETMDIDLLSARSEGTVGFLLIAIGLWALLRARRVLVHAHPHEGHAHPHVHVGDDSHVGGLHTHAALGVGALHGMAGAGHLLGVLPSLALPTAQAATYLLAYLCSAVLSMAGFARLLGGAAGSLGPRPLRALVFASGLCSIGVGGYWIGQNL